MKISVDFFIWNAFFISMNKCRPLSQYWYQNIWNFSSDLKYIWKNRGKYSENWLGLYISSYDLTPIGTAKNIPLFRYRLRSHDWCNRVINYCKWKSRPECSTWMRNIFVSVNDVGVIIKTNFGKHHWMNAFPRGVNIISTSGQDVSANFPKNSGK